MLPLFPLVSVQLVSLKFLFVDWYWLSLLAACDFVTAVYITSLLRLEVLSLLVPEELLNGLNALLMVYNRLR